MQTRKSQKLIKFEKQLEEIHKRMGKLAHSTFENFNIDRSFEPKQIPFQGKMVLMDEYIQRKAFEKAFLACREYAENCASFENGWMYIQGFPGAGKSHLAAAILHRHVATQLKPDWIDPEDDDTLYFSADYISAPEMLMHIRDGIKDNTYSKRINDLCTVDFLVIDDIGGTTKRTDWVDETMFQIINSRDKHELATIFTSNVEYDTLEPRIADRIAGNAELVLMPISSYRRLKS